MISASAGYLLNLTARPSRWMRASFLTIILSGSLVGVMPVGQAHAAAPITQSGLNTQVSPPVNLPSGQTQYNITGGTRPGGGTNLFHSFGDFNVPTNNIANFLNETALPTSNILGRVTGENPSVIFGMIQTNGPGGFGNANLFLMNPSGFLFGPNAALNVGGMVAFTTADYLRFQGTDTLFNSASTPQSLSALSIAPVAAFGFLGNNPAAIAIQGSTFKVADGQSLSLVGGNQGFIATDPDTGNPIPVTGGITITGGKLSAPGGQINVASVAAPGEVSAVDFMPTPGITMGNITLSQGALLDVSADAAGTVRIRGGQFVIENATISADTGNSPGALTAIDIDFTDAVSLTTTSLSALTARTFGAGNAGDIVISSGSLTATFGTDAFDVALIDSHTMGSGHGGNVTITTGLLSATGTLPQSGNFIGSGTGADGNGGNVTIIAGDAQFTSMFIDTGLNTFFGSGSGGNLTVKAQSLIIDNVLWGTDSMGRAGAIDLESAGLLRITGNSFISSQGLLGNNPITIKADRFVLDFTRILAGTLEDGGDVSVTSRIVEFSNGGSIGTQTFGDGHAGNIFITASERVSFMDDPNSLTPSGLYTTSLGGAGNLGNAGNITVDTPRLELINGARINASTFTFGQGGNVTITNADSILITGERSPGPPFEELLQGGTRASGIYTSTLGSDFCTGACGNAGHIDITTGSLTLQNGGLIDSGTTNNGQGGSITIGATGQALLSGTMADGTPGGIFSRTTGTAPDSGAGGNITLTAGQSVTMATGAVVSASSTGPADAGNIQVKAGQQLDMQDSSIKTEAAQASGGNISIQAVEHVRLVNSTISTSVLGGGGSGGNISIDPNVVVLQNSQVIAQAVQGAGGNITITTPLFLADQTSLVSASSEFGLNGTVTIQNPTSNLSESLGPLPSSMLEQQALQAQRCAALHGGASSSFIIAGRDTVPTEPGGWLASSLGLHSLGHSLLADTMIDEQPPTTLVMTEASESISLRRLTPLGFLTQRFAGNGSDGCRS
jgi:filamentous hemagglutinin family protein